MTDLAATLGAATPGVMAPGAGAPPEMRLATARQAIHAADGSVVAYELLFRDGSGGTGDLSAPGAAERATSFVIAEAFSGLGAARAGSGLPLFVNLPRGFLVGELPLPCSPSSVVLEVLEGIRVDEQLLAGLAVLRGQGFAVAVDDYEGDAERAALLPLADYVKIDVLSLAERTAEVIRAVRRAAPRAQVVAERVEQASAVPDLAALGVDLFQGYAFHRPSVLASAGPHPSQVVALRLLAQLTTGEATAGDVEPLVSADPALALRVLRAANSAGSGATREVRSLRQALVLLGPQQLTAWVLLMLLGGSARASAGELITALARAGSCAHLAPAHHRDEAFTVGLMSGASQVLGLEIVDVVRGTGLSLTVRDALLHHSGPLGAVLAAVLAQDAEEPLPGSGPPPLAVTRACLQGLNDALALVRSAWS